MVFGCSKNMAASMMIHRRSTEIFKQKVHATGALCYAFKWNGTKLPNVGLRHHHADSSLTRNSSWCCRQMTMTNASLRTLANYNNRIFSVTGIRLASTSTDNVTSALNPIESPITTNLISEISTPSPEVISSVSMNAAHARSPATEISSPTPELLSPLVDPIPEPPSPVLEEIVEAVKPLGEPSFASQGLGGWSPVGIVQNCMEYLHISCDLPWWTSIMIGTVVVRTVIFPLVILAQRNAAKMNNNLPQLQVLQLKMTEARQSGNQLDAARYGQEMMLFMKEKQLNPFKNMLVPLAQAPLFISFFMGLRGMANVPVESMRTGGMFWFEDLTMPDQFFLLPIITSATMWLTIEVGTDSARLSAANMQMMKYFLRALPVCILPFTVNFPGAILCYWVSTNFISLAQVGVLRIPAVRDYFKIERLVTHSPDSLPVKPKGFVKGMRESWTNMKITKEMEERQRFDEIAFQRAGRGPIQKTYKHDPTRPRESATHIAAKKRE